MITDLEALERTIQSITVTSSDEFPSLDDIAGISRQIKLKIVFENQFTFLIF